MNSIIDSDPFGSYPLEELLNVQTSKAPKDFDVFWHNAYQSALNLSPDPVLTDTGQVHHGWKIFDVSFTSTDSIKLGGWLLVPAVGQVNRAFVVGHGYGGRDGPDYNLPFSDAAIFFPCCRGISRSAIAPFSEDPYWHVIHDIDIKDRYIIRGCVEDIWLSVSVLEFLYPQLADKIGLLGISFSGGVGMLALAQDKRIVKAHFNVPTFGNYQWRLRLPTHGSGKSIQDFYHREPFKLIRTLRYYDAAHAATKVTVPVHFALALRDSVVTPVGQFAIYNQVNSEKHLFVLEAGHDDYPNQEQQSKQLIAELSQFFKE
jgi:cephalosporin-C deacetylase